MNRRQAKRRLEDLYEDVRLRVNTSVMIFYARNERDKIVWIRVDEDDMTEHRSKADALQGARGVEVKEQRRD